MSLLKLLQQAQGGQGLGQIAAQLGLDENKTSELTSMLAPAIGSAARKRAEGGGLEDVLGALRGQSQAGMFDDASSAASAQGQAQGMEFLEKLMGGRQEADNLASEAAQRAGVEPNIVQQLLPALAAMAQGGLQKQMPDSTIDGLMASFSGAAQSGAKQEGGLMGLVGGLLGGQKSAGTQGTPDLSMLTQLLDADGDGSPLDDILEKFTR